MSGQKRVAAQILIEEIGAEGPEGVVKTARRAVAIIQDLRKLANTVFRMRRERDEALGEIQSLNETVYRLRADFLGLQAHDEYLIAKLRCREPRTSACATSWPSSRSKTMSKTMSTSNFSGPMFSPKEDDYRKSIFGRSGGHYNIFATHNLETALEMLHDTFPDGQCDEFGFVLFSTSGVHGSYVTIEEVAERASEVYDPDDDDEPLDEVTFLLVQPRIVSMTYGNVRVRPEDVEWLQRLRSSSWDAVRKIGAGAGDAQLDLVAENGRLRAELAEALHQTRELADIKALIRTREGQL